MAQYRKKPVTIEAVQFDGTMASVDGFLTVERLVRGRTMEIKTLEGWMHAAPGDWIIKGVQGEFYPVREDIFLATYEPVSDEPPVA